MHMVATAYIFDISTILFRSCWVSFQKPPIFSMWTILFPPKLSKSIVLLRSCWVPFWTLSGAPLLILTRSAPPPPPHPRVWAALSQIYFFSTVIFWDTDNIMWATFCDGMNLKVFICHTTSFLFIYHYMYLFLIDTVGNMICARTVAVWHSWSLRSNLFLCIKSILLCMDCSYVQNQSNNVSIDPAEEPRIQPVKWWSPCEGQLINKGALFVALCTPSLYDCPFSLKPNK